MKPTIRAIFLDLGNTLRMLDPHEPTMQAARARITSLLGLSIEPNEYNAVLEERYKGYRKWAFGELREASEEELWTKWLAPDLPADRVEPLAPELTYLFRQSKGRRILVEGGREVLDELQQRGYVLGIISNLIGKREIPEWLKTDDFERYFKAVVLSSVYGRRKPHPSIYLEASQRAGVEPAACVYVGDNLKRDVHGARAAGYGMVIILLSPAELAQAEITDENRPDLIIHDFRSLLDHFPPLSGQD